MRPFYRMGLCLAAAGVAATAQASSFKKLWNDGRAEVAFYDSEFVVDGKPRAFREQLITTKEQLRTDTLGRADNPKQQRVVDVFELDQVQRVDLENYPRNTLTSVFVQADDLQHLVKMSVSVQDWTGNAFKMLKTSPAGDEATVLTYANQAGESDQSTELTLGQNAYIDDQLPLSLRDLPFKDGLEQNIKYWISLSSKTNAGLYPMAAAAVLSVSGPEEVRSHAGALPCWLVTLKKAGGDDKYWFEKAEPHLLVKMQTADGRRRLLYGRARWSYWDKRIPRPNILN
jgi:hypothetical protein